MTGKGSPSTTGYIGVVKGGKYTFRVFCKGIYIGSYPSKIEAAKAYDKAAKEMGLSKFNFPEVQ